MTKPGATGRDGRASHRSGQASRPRLAGKGRPASRGQSPPARTGALAHYERTLASIMVGSAVRVARHRAGVSQAELAKRAGTSQPSIARLEQGHISPTVVSLERIARALGTELVIDFEPLADRPSLRAPQRL
jgi:ribosome-binding protein aMBF1 (putative translation factor)